MVRLRLTWPELFDCLRAPQGRILYVQSSADWIERAGFRTADAIEALCAWAGDRGTVVMPTYPCRTSHLEYLQAHPTYDVRRTPAGVGLIAELFRRTSASVRSLDPDFCVSAMGAEAVDITTTDLTNPDPFGADSIYARMIARRATLVGLGVSLNTNSFIHVIDSEFQSRYPRPVYEDEPFRVDVIDGNGGRRQVWRRAVRPEFQQRTRPSAIADALSGDAAFRRVEIDGAQFFAWDLALWRDWCVPHADRELAAGRAPCWLKQIW